MKIHNMVQGLIEEWTKCYGRDRGVCPDCYLGQWISVEGNALEIDLNSNPTSTQFTSGTAVHTAFTLGTSVPTSLKMTRIPQALLISEDCCEN